MIKRGRLPQLAAFILSKVIFKSAQRFFVVIPIETKSVKLILPLCASAPLRETLSYLPKNFNLLNSVSKALAKVKFP